MSSMALNDLTVARQLEVAQLGCVKIEQLDQLLFEDIDVFGSRALEQSNIDRLLYRFEHEGCRRLDPLT